MKNLLAILSPVILCLSASAQRVTEVTPDTVGKQDHFGFSVGLSGDFAMIGAYADSRQNVYHRGIVYVYRELRNKWTLVGELEPPIVGETDQFGYSLDIDGDWAAIGAPGSDIYKLSAGAVYTFHYQDGQWVHHSKLTPSDLKPYDTFGKVVRLSGDTLVVSCIENLSRREKRGDKLVKRPGQVQVFKLSPEGNWEREAILHPDDFKIDNDFGYAIDVDEDVIAIGAPQDDTSTPDGGGVYVFERIAGHWQRMVKFVSDPRNYEIGFGYSIAVSGDSILAGSRSTGSVVENAGSVHVLRRSEDQGWFKETMLIPLDLQKDDHTGSSVAIDKDVVVIGSPHEDERGSAAGSIYSFQEDGDGTWRQTNKVAPHQLKSLDYFGSHIVVDGSTVLVGADHDSGKGEWSGTAYFLQDFYERY
jgi:hypothetical protein